MSDAEQMGRNAYARHRGCSANAVTKAVRDGRIARAVIWKDGHIDAIKWRLADELWTKNTDAGRVPLSSQARAAVQTHALDAGERAQAVLGHAFADGFVAWAALLVHRHQVDAARAASMIADLALAQATAIAGRYGGDGVLLAGDLQAALSADAQPALLERIRAAAQAYLTETHHENCA